MLRFLRGGGGIGLIIGFTFIPEATKGQVQNGAPSKDGIPSTDDPSFVSPDVASDWSTPKSQSFLPGVTERPGAIPCKS
jgi:hypothetical protein